MTLPTLKSERLVLRPLKLEDTESLHAAFSDTELMTYWSSGPHENIGQTRDYLRTNAESGDYPTWAITYDGGDAMGWLVFIPHREGVREIGYILRRDAWGRGIALEAIMRMLEYGFGELGLRRVFADVDPDNAPSITLLEKLGFQREGLLRGEWETHIGVRDSYIYGLLADEWAQV